MIESNYIDPVMEASTSRETPKEVLKQMSYQILSKSVTTMFSLPNEVNIF